MLPNLTLEKTGPFLKHIGIHYIEEDGPQSSNKDNIISFYLLESKKFKCNLINTLLHQVDFEEKVNFTFSMYDTNNNGYIEYEEFQSLLAHFNHYNSYHFDKETLKSIVDILFEEIDIEKTGKISKNNFRKFLEHYKDKPLSLNPFGKERSFTFVSSNPKKIDTNSQAIELKSLEKPEDQYNEYKIKHMNKNISNSQTHDSRNFSGKADNDLNICDNPNQELSAEDEDISYASVSTKNFEYEKNILNKKTHSCIYQLRYLFSKYFYLLIYCFLNALVGGGYFYRYYMSKGLLVLAFAKLFAGMIMFNSFTLTFYACENAITFILGCKCLKWLKYIVPLENIRKYHKLSGMFFCVAGLGHTLSHLLGTYPTFSTADLATVNTILQVKLDAVPTYYFLLFKTIPGVTGIILVALCLIIYLTSIERIRKFHFELFWNSHKLYLLILPLNHIHGMQQLVANQEFMYFIALPGFMFILFELLIRFIRLFTLKVNIKSIKYLDSKVTEIVVEKPRNFSPLISQYVRINFSFLNWLEWHPITIASSPHDRDLVFYIAPLGDWSNSLADLAKFIMHKEAQEQGDNTEKDYSSCKDAISENMKIDSPSKKQKEVERIYKSYISNKFCRIDGPFGAPTQNFFKHKHLIFIASGIGATPFISIFFDIIYFNENGERKNSESNIYKNMKIEFYWIIKDYSSCSWLIHLFKEIINKDVNKKIAINLIFTQSQQKYDLRSFFLWHGLDILKKKRPNEISQYCGNISLGRPDWDKMFYSRKINILSHWSDSKGTFIYYNSFQGTS